MDTYTQEDYEGMAADFIHNPLVKHATPVTHAVSEIANQTSAFGDSSGGSESMFTRMLHFVILVVAVYLAYKCTLNETDMGKKVLHFVGAFCCSPCYIVYALLISKCASLKM